MRFKPILLIIFLVNMSRAENTCMAGMIKYCERAVDSIVNAMDNYVERSNILEKIVNWAESIDVQAMFYTALSKLT